METERVERKATYWDEKLGKEIEYYIDSRMKKTLDEKIIPSLLKKDKDCVLGVDGNEGTGKSFFAFQIAKYVDPSFNLNRVVFSPDAFRDAIYKAKKGQAIVFDEAFTGLSSRTSLSGTNKVLVSLMMQMRQKNLFVIIVLPTFFLLDKYVALFRARALIHVYEVKGKRGYFRVYNRRLKKILYLIGHKTLSYNQKLVRTQNKGRFYGKFALGGDIEEEKYRQKKSKAFEETEKSPINAAQIKYMEQRDLLLFLMKQTTKFSYEELSNRLLEYDFKVSTSQLSRICLKFGGKPEENPSENGEESKEMD